MNTISVKNDKIEVTITGESNQFWGQDLFTRGITELISSADTDGWEKSYLERQGDTSPTEQFYAAILAAVAQHYMVDMSELSDEEYTVEQALALLIDQLRMNGHLQNVATK